MRVRAPGSSANLGAGFDAVGLALGLYLEVDTDLANGRGSVVDERHPAAVAYREAGGVGSVLVDNAIPEGRGLGFSGAARVAGAFAGAVMTGQAAAPARGFAYRVAARLEGHGDNAAASAFGGVVVAAGDAVGRVPLRRVPGLVVWVPSFTTSTKRSRATLASEVPLSDAVYNIGRAALLVAALASGDHDLLEEATKDRLHQDQRLSAAPGSRAALDALLEAGAWAAWLSGSGPTVAAFVDPGDAERFLGVLPSDGRGRVLAIDQVGVVAL